MLTFKMDGDDCGEEEILLMGKSHKNYLSKMYFRKYL